MYYKLGKQIQNLLSANTFFFCLFAIVAACSTYAFMYGFRKPVAVGLYQDAAWLGLSLKTLYLTAQILGYALSKFIGIKVISELQSHGRAKATLALVLFAWFALFGFAIFPAPWNSVFMLLNGLPLGMVWGIVFSYLEGRRVTEILAAGLCTSFILASGIVKTVASILLIDYHVSEIWMPFVTASLFLPFLCVSVWMLDKLPPPNQDDIDQRCKRVPMNKTSRKELLKLLGLGIIMLIFGYILLTILRDLRDSFAADVWQATGLSGAPALFTLTELPIALVVLVIIALLKLVKNNHTAMIINHLLICLGFIITLISSLAYEHNKIGPISWMIFNGIGLYLAYVPFTTSLFERLIATFNRPANVGFLTYLADSFGYLGTVGVMVYQSANHHTIDWNIFLRELSYFTGIIGCILTLFSLCFFMYKEQQSDNNRERAIA
ncbi:DUF5690 family protein [Pseudoalteromonas luteoviolacea]|uniref:Major facilitator superfamily (MFS) profile domain-containing protein n=1 Tax=Pseudoalteromonas luteoviolacea S4054 TaxID=1129367 RepID=A0A0F6A969_9GAMM|nr:DUF5690 family protein [Pseudoalteromonas luteoviolacea]AOT10655.1 hypothetical protein S4054249_22610 [Pseudoalteromonas luteoviolacea]AOT15277.1 hypothetical protein S40542_20985 [Pseudoalteromonas luteoviolacea]AOT20474.1 hypothetical protein S4054_22525 [Pseudoalteromonas luteoviolacea]KKE81939.1 hypothetical protein N479_20695 [Pseudoalteromonas luteoviolacea S4054]KZN67760.1 hypothetical protein N481_23985 [Pseudoalteromonas luteoviolacea S4047-1]